jgi:mannose-1-phosphate guanylyltransferase/mannose-6-phosphate isomerase
MERLFVVTAESQANEVREILSDRPPQNILVEPVGKNTAPAIALAAAHILDKDPNAIMAVLPSDHIIEPRDKFLADIEEGARLADARRAFAIFGIRPTRPDTGYGYIEVGHKLEGHAFGVASFKEKPNLKKAKDYLGTGRYLWNSGMFVFRADVYVEKMRRHLPNLFAAWERYASGKKSAVDLNEYYAAAEAVSIDHGIMEKLAGDVAVIAAGFNWSDVGSWDATDDLWQADEKGNRARGGELFPMAAEGNTVVSKKLVALLGVENLIVVETDDAILIAKKEKAQEIKNLVEEMERRGLNRYL